MILSSSILLIFQILFVIGDEVSDAGVAKARVEVSIMNFKI